MKEKLKELKRLISIDINENSKNNNLKNLYITILAEKWINANANNLSEISEKIKAIKDIINSSDFIDAINANTYAYNSNNDNKAEEAANAIRMIKEQEKYINAEETGYYKILSKYEKAETHKTNSLLEYKNDILLLIEYIEGKVNEVEKGCSEQDYRCN